MAQAVGPSSTSAEKQLHKHQKHDSHKLFQVVTRYHRTIQNKNDKNEEQLQAQVACLSVGSSLHSGGGGGQVMIP